jgi:hypothetical protein
MGEEVLLAADGAAGGEGVFGYFLVGEVVFEAFLLFTLVGLFHLG